MAQKQKLKQEKKIEKVEGGWGTGGWWGGHWSQGSCFSSCRVARLDGAGVKHLFRKSLQPGEEDVETGQDGETQPTDGQSADRFFFFLTVGQFAVDFQLLPEKFLGLEHRVLVQDLVENHSQLPHCGRPGPVLPMFVPLRRGVLGCA